MPSIKKEEIKKGILYSKKENLLKALNKVYENIPSGDCLGCGNCCMESIGISFIEFLNIYDYLEKNKSIKYKVMKKIIDYYFLEYIQKSPCPFKDENNRCIIYPVRPLNCRLYGNWEKEDYEKNYEKVKKQNLNFAKDIEKYYGIKVNPKVSNYKIQYCKDFKPQRGYLSKEERLNFSDEIVTLDSTLYREKIISIDFKDRGIVEYFIESIFYIGVANNIKLHISKEDKKRKFILSRIKKLVLGREKQWN